MDILKLGSILILFLSQTAFSIEVAEEAQFDWKYRVYLTVHDGIIGSCTKEKPCLEDANIKLKLGEPYKHNKMTWTCVVEKAKEYKNEEISPNNYAENSFVKCTESGSNSVVQAGAFCMKERKNGRKIDSNSAGVDSLEQTVDKKLIL